MLARIRMSLEGKEEGFTLIELFVVIIIIGILAAIAIPVFGFAATADSLVAGTANSVGSDSVSLSAGNKIVLTKVGVNGFCLTVTSTKSSNTYVYDSLAGGLKTGASPACSSASY